MNEENAPRTCLSFIIRGGLALPLHSSFIIRIPALLSSRRVGYAFVMASVRVDIVCIGTLSRNRLWNETAAMRTPHATTTLVRTGKRNILIDPGLPGQILAARLTERTGMNPAEIDARSF